MRICVLSDAHYKYKIQNKEDEENSAILLSFLTQAKGKYDLMILAGDIFDLWYDWQYTIIKQYFPLLVKLHELSESGCKLVHISGNHDFWFGNFLPDYINIKLEPDSYVMVADGKKIHVCHGDTHTVNDLRYHLFRTAIRLPIVKKIFGLLHPDLALGLGSKMSRSSRARRDVPEMRERKNAGLTRYATELITKGKADYVIMGHSHNPILKNIENGYYANSGDWICHRSFIEIIDGIISLKHYYITKGEQA